MKTSTKGKHASAGKGLLADFRHYRGGWYIDFSSALNKVKSIFVDFITLAQNVVPNIAP